MRERLDLLPQLHPKHGRLELKCTPLKWLSEGVQEQIRQLRKEEGKRFYPQREMIKHMSEEARTEPIQPLQGPAASLEEHCSSTTVVCSRCLDQLKHKNKL